MTDKQSNELSMSKAVQEVLNSNLVIVQSIPKFAAAKTELDNKISAINNAAKIQTKQIKGNRQDKEKAANEATDAALALIGPAKSYATDGGNNTLYEAL